MASNNKPSRRKFLKAAGSAATTVVVAGCAGNGSGGSSSGNGNGSGDSSSGNGNGSGGSSSGNGSGGQTLIYSGPNQLATLDPQNAVVGNDEIRIFTQLYDSLLSFKPGTTSVQPGLAKDYKLNNKTVELTLREKVKFSDGSEFTANDVVATFRRFTDPEYDYYLGEKDASSYGQFTFGHVESMSKDGDYNLTIELDQKFAPFLRNLAMWSSVIISKKAIENDQNLADTPAGTGPFTLKNLDNQNKRIRLSARKDYFGEGPHVDEVLFQAVGENSTRTQSLINGDADIVYGMSPQSAQKIQSSDGVKLKSKPGLNIGKVAFNFSNFEPFREKKVRKAINYAINVEAIVKNLYSGFAQVADQPLPPSMFGYNKELEPYPYNQEKAKKLLSQTDYSDGFKFELVTFKNPRGYNLAPIQTAETIRSNLSDIGITMNINKMPFSAYITYVRNNKHEAALNGWVTDNADPDNFLYQLLDPGVPVEKLEKGKDWADPSIENYHANNSSAWANRDFISLVRKAQRTYSKEERTKLYKQAEKVAHDEVPWAYLAYIKIFNGVSSRVNNFYLPLALDPNLNTVKLN